MKIPKELRRKIENELHPGEFIRWAEQPIPRFFTASSIGILLFGIPWTSIFILLIWGALTDLRFNLPDPREGLQLHPQGLGSLILFTPFLLIGCRMLSDPFWVWHDAQNSAYLVTDKRAISIRFGWPTTIRSYLPDQLKDMHRTERADGTGDVIFSILLRKNSDGPDYYEKIGFSGVRNPREVENILKHLAQNNA